MTVPERLIRLVAAALLAAVIALLALNMPEFAVPTRLSSAGGIERALAFLAWLGLLLLIFGLLLRLTRARQRTGRLASVRNLHPSPPRQRAQPLRGGYASEAFPLTVRPRATALARASAADAAAGATDERSSAKAAISLLGPPTISCLRQRDRGLRGTTRELLLYLALHPGGAQREQLIDALWPDHTPEQGRKRLWRASADARAQLGEAAVHRNGDRYQLNRDQVDVDLDTLERLLGRLASSGEQPAVLERALALFRGEPLAGLDLSWAEGEQRRLQALRLDLLARTARALLDAGDATSALARAEEGLAAEPYNEKLARIAMQAEAALGLRRAVIDRYRRLRETLQEQLGLEPHAETKRLYRQLLGQDEPQPASHA